MITIPMKDWAGVAVALLLVVGIVGCNLLGRPVSAELHDGFVLCLGWIFRSGVQVANDTWHRVRSNGNDNVGPTTGDTP